MGLFTNEEITAIKKEYDYKERLNNSSTSEDSSVFTVHGLDTSGNNESGIDHSKSTILAPFNTNDECSNEFIEEIKAQTVNKKIIKFSSKLREVNRQYERDNNSNIDNGVYVQSAPFTQPSRITTSKSQSINSKVDEENLNKMEKMGFEKPYVKNSIKKNMHNCATTCYYLMNYD